MKSLIRVSCLTASKTDYMPGSAGGWNVSHCSHDTVSYRCLFNVSSWIVISKILVPFLTICFWFHGVLLNSDQQGRIAERNLNLALTCARRCTRQSWFAPLAAEGCFVCPEVVVMAVAILSSRTWNFLSFFGLWQSLKRLGKSLGIDLTYTVILPNILPASSFLNHKMFLHIQENL